MKKIVMLIILSSFVKILMAQEAENNEHKPKIRGAIMMANTHVPNATEGG